MLYNQYPSREGVFKGDPGQPLNHIICLGPCGSFQLPSSPIIDRTSQNMLFIELEQEVPKCVWIYRWNVELSHDRDIKHT